MTAGWWTLRPGPEAAPAPLGAVLTATFLGSVSGGSFWAGMYFVTARHYGFSPARNLVLAAIMGAAYALSARGAGALLRRVERRLSPRAVLGLTLMVQAAAALAPPLVRSGEAVVWIAAVIGVAASAVTWPIVEGFLSAGRHGPELRAAIGAFNVTWTPAVAVPLLIMPLIAQVGVVWTLAVAALSNLAALATLPWFPTRPCPDGRPPLERGVGPEYVWLARSAAVLLPVSYVVSSTISPVLPHRLRSVGVPADVASLVAACWMLARFATLALMWRIGAWHGRWGTLAAGAAALTGGLGAVLLASTLPGLVAGLLLFGIGMAIIYYAALYYAFAVGEAAVDAGGVFEGLIGLGYCVGPALGLAAHALATPGRQAEVTVAFTWMAVALASYPAARPYLRARRNRGAT